MDFKMIVEGEGCRYIGEENGVVRFVDPETGLRLSLYSFCCDAETIRLTLKNVRGPVEDFPPLLPTESP